MELPQSFFQNSLIGKEQIPLTDEHLKQSIQHAFSFIHMKSDPYRFVSMCGIPLNACHDLATACKTPANHAGFIRGGGQSLLQSILHDITLLDSVLKQCAITILYHLLLPTSGLSSETKHRLWNDVHMHVNHCAQHTTNSETKRMCEWIQNNVETWSLKKN